MIILSEEFQRFFDRSARVMERALSESVDIYTDYTGVSDGEDGMWVLPFFVYTLADSSLNFDTVIKSL